MKNLYLVGLLGLCLACTHASIAQETPLIKQQAADKPFIFSQLPGKISCDQSELEKLISLDVASSVNLKLSSSLQLEGILVDKIQRNPAALCINIKLLNYPGTVFNLSFISKDGSLQKINGRILNPKSGDVLVLIEENKQLFLKKELQRLVMAE